MLNTRESFDVIVAGAGPVGLCLAIDLGRRGVRCLLLERNPTTAHWPKMDRSNARTMEIWRRFGIADRVRALGYPADNPMDVFLLTRMTEPPIAVIKCPSVGEYREKIRACTDGSQPLEPYQLVAQNVVEPLLKSIAEETPNVTVRYGHGLVDLAQDAGGVTVSAQDLEGAVQQVRAAYLVGCDGGASTVRKKLGIALQGRGGIREMTQVIFGSDDLYERIPVGKGRHYSFLDGSMIVAQGSRKEFTFHTTLPATTDFASVLRDRIGFDCQLEIRHIVGWRYNLLLADRYRDGRVLLAGDAAHLVIPTGGLGMNTGVGDAFDLGWKLAGAVQGWGHDALLDSYERERRPVGRFNVESAGWAAEGAMQWAAEVTPEAYEDTAAGAALRQRIGVSFVQNHGRMHGMVGAEMSYSYAGSALIAEEPGNEPVWERNCYQPHARPGVRVPHLWLADGRALQDLLGNDYTLLDLTGSADTAALEAGFRRVGAPLQVLSLDEPHIRQVFGRSLLLLRPDLHIAWSGNALPTDAAGLAAMATGNSSAMASAVASTTVSAMATA